MNRNIIEEMIDAHAGAYRHERAGADLRRRVQRRRVRNASLTGVGAVAAVGGVAVAGTSLGGINRGFTPEAWAPAPSPYAPDINGDGIARVPLPTPPQAKLPAITFADPVTGESPYCPPFPPAPTSNRGHATATLDEVHVIRELRFNLSPESSSWEDSWTSGAVANWTLSSTTGAPTSVRVSQTRLYFVSEGIVQEVWTSWEALRAETLAVRDGEDAFIASAGRDLRHLGGDTLNSSVTHMYLGGFACTNPTNALQYTTLMTGREYQVYLEVRVVADEQSAAQLHLQDEGVDLDTVTGNNGTLITVYQSGGATNYEAIDVTFPASYLQDQFDEVLVSEPITVRIPDSWGN